MDRSYTLSICAIYMFVMTLCYISKGVGMVFNSDHRDSQMGYKMVIPPLIRKYLKESI